MTTSASAVSMVRNASEKEMGNGDFHKVIIQKKKNSDPSNNYRAQLCNIRLVRREIRHSWRKSRLEQKPRMYS